MNVYDFDGTIYRGDSTVDFYLFLLRRHPFLFLCLPCQFAALLRYKAGGCSATVFKERFFVFLSRVPKIEEEVLLFWKTHFRKIAPWYGEVKEAGDLVISASPEFLLREPCRRLGIRPPIATRCDCRSGKITGENCKGEEKVLRFRSRYPAATVGCFYSDSETDLPLARLAERAYLVRGGHAREWRISSPETERRTR